MASNGDKLTYFLVGGFVGAAVALLFAPRSGQETRQYIEGKYREGTERLVEKTAESADAIKARTASLAEKARQQSGALGEKSREMVGKVGETIDRGKETLQRQKDQLARAVEAGKQAYTEEKQKLGAVED